MFQNEFEKGEFSFIFVKENDGENILEDIRNFIVNKKALNYIAYYDISIGVISAIIGAFQLVIK